MKLPPLRDPTRYVGLFVYDFGDRVSVGYTAGEVAILRASPDHAAGTPYLILRGTEDGGLEFCGVTDDRLLGHEATCFLLTDAARATEDFDRLRRAARTTPVPAPVELVLARVYAFDPPHATALLYPAPSAALVASWLAQTGFDGGHHMLAGTKAHAALAAPDCVRIAAEELPGLMDYHDRPAEEVLASVGYAVQR